ncbi:hypothetical protein SCAR479_01861 [Seiridium cardinale]|uniref:Uncharacterized protein n=1 Tax=Seiridium cardinale TaxID=138064 RepID=A0ABR2Y3L6_9PEZI
MLRDRDLPLNHSFLYANAVLPMANVNVDNMIEDTARDNLSTPWARELLKRPLVEIRRGISLGYDPPHENQSVLALTAPSGKFVDIRFDVASYQGSYIEPYRKAFHGVANGGLCVPRILPGTDSCAPYECVIHVRWQHSIDSAGSFSTEGADMYLLSNGDVMEVGTVELKGKVHMFKEYWIKPRAEARQLPCIVVETEGRQHEDEVQGMVIRIGDFCQGILQDKNGCQISLERWELASTDAGWRKDTRSNTGPANAAAIMPSRWIIEADRKVGESVIINGRKWEVAEVYNG